MRTGARAAALALAAAACDPGFERPSWVRDLRILGAKADPPEVVGEVDPDDPEATPIPPVTLSPLVADPAAGRRLEWRMRACPPTRSLRCDDDEAPRVPAGSGTAEDPESLAGAVILGEVVATAQLIQASYQPDDLAGFGGVAVQVEILLAPEGGPVEEAVYGSKRIVYAPKVPPERTANTHPRIEALLADDATFPAGRCADPAAPVLEVRAGQEVRLEPVEPVGARETYVLPTFDGGKREITENLRYSWFATAGRFSSEQTGGPIDLFGNSPPLDTGWRAPTADGPSPPPVRVTLWVVQRDERGGVSFEERCVSVLP